MIKQLWNWIMI